MNFRVRVLLIAAAAVVAAWLVALGGYSWARRSQVTAEKVCNYISSVDFAALNPEQRAAAIKKLSGQINALSADERIRLQLEHAWENWFLEMTEPEKAAFIEATMPTGIKQMMNAFEEMPEAKRKKTIEAAMKRLRDAHELPVQNNPFRRREGTPVRSPLPVSSELERRVRAVGLKTFYAESSAQTKAEVAPLLEEMQRLMESGVALH